MIFIPFLVFQLRWIKSRSSPNLVVSSQRTAFGLSKDAQSQIEKVI